MIRTYEIVAMPLNARLRFLTDMPDMNPGSGLLAVAIAILPVADQHMEEYPMPFKAP